MCHLLSKTLRCAETQVNYILAEGAIALTTSQSTINCFKNYLGQSTLFVSTFASKYREVGLPLFVYDSCYLMLLVCLETGCSASCSCSWRKLG